MDREQAQEEIMNIRVILYSVSYLPVTKIFILLCSSYPYCIFVEVQKILIWKRKTIVECQVFIV
jgi:hypothetical protein